MASSTLVSLGQGMGIAGGGFVIAMIAAWLIQHCSAQSYAELACMMPHAGGIRSYTKVAMGSLPAMAAVILGYVVPNMLAAPTELAVAGSIISETFFPSVPAAVWGGILLFLLTATNFIGVDIFARLQILFTFTMMLQNCKILTYLKMHLPFLHQRLCLKMLPALINARLLKKTS